MLYKKIQDRIKTGKIILIFRIVDIDQKFFGKWIPETYILKSQRFFQKQYVFLYLRAKKVLGISYIDDPAPDPFQRLPSCCRNFRLYFSGLLLRTLPAACFTPKNVFQLFLQFI